MSIQEQSVAQRLTPERALELLSYADTLRGAEQAAALSANQASPSAQRYARTLAETVDEHGPSVELLAEGMSDAVCKTLEVLGIEPSVYAHSVSWAYWDLAKQTYLAEHPEQSSQHYTLADPLQKGDAGARKRLEILDRHLGWELDQLRSSDDSRHGARIGDPGRFQARMVATGLWQQLQALRAHQSNATGQLPSHVLAQMGTLLREEALRLYADRLDGQTEHLEPATVADLQAVLASTAPLLQETGEVAAHRAAQVSNPNLPDKEMSAPYPNSLVGSIEQQLDDHAALQARYAGIRDLHPISDAETIRRSIADAETELAQL